MCQDLFRLSMRIRAGRQWGKTVGVQRIQNGGVASTLLTISAIVQRLNYMVLSKRRFVPPVAHHLSAKRVKIPFSISAWPMPMALAKGLALEINNTEWRELI